VQANQSNTFGSTNSNRRSSLLLLGATPMNELNENVKETDGEDDEYSDDADQKQQDDTKAAK